MNASPVAELGERDVREIVEGVMTAFVPPSTQAPAEDGAPETWGAYVGISGAFEGLVCLQCSRRLALCAARAMFGDDSSRPLDEQARDALSELTNMVGGTVKSLISTLTGSVCSLSLPTLLPHNSETPEGRPVNRCELRWLGEPITVTVAEQIAQGSST